MSASCLRGGSRLQTEGKSKTTSPMSFQAVVAGQLCRTHTMPRSFRTNCFGNSEQIHRPTLPVRYHKLSTLHSCRHLCLVQVTRAAWADCAECWHWSLQCPHGYDFTPRQHAAAVLFRPGRSGARFPPSPPRTSFPSWPCTPPLELDVGVAPDLLNSRETAPTPTFSRPPSLLPQPSFVLCTLNMLIGP